MEEKRSSAPMLGNRYQIQQTLGSGGMSVVYKARDLMLERPVAIKVLRQDYSKDATFREKFRLEAKAAANLSHPNIVTVHDFGFDSGRLYLVMEYVPGTDLKTRIKRQGRFEVDEAIPLIVQACAGIGYAHRASLIHCDVKPQNMIVTPEMRLKVTDFGIARVLASINPDEQLSVVWGSPQYFSPEQASGLAPSPASDVYSLGVILYEMLTGRLPFISEDPSELARMHREVIPEAPLTYCSDIPPALNEIIMKVLSKEPAARYRTADQLGRVLLTFSQQANPYEENISSLDQVASPAYSLPVSQRANSEVAPLLPSDPKADTQESVVKQFSSVDWGSIGLGLLALLTVGGLIPFWMYVWFTFNPPGR